MITKSLSSANTESGYESGFTLIELLVAMTMAVIVTGAAVMLLITALRDQPKVSNRADQVGQARVSMERMVRELRQGVSGSVVEEGGGPTGSQVSFDSYVAGNCGTEAVSEKSLCKVTYSCTGETCTRVTQGIAGGSASPATVIAAGIADPGEVFEYTHGGSTCPTVSGETIIYVSVNLNLKNSDGSTTTLASGASPRSCP